MVRPTKKVRIRETASGFQVRVEDKYLGHIKHDAMITFAVMCRRFGTRYVLGQLQYIKKGHNNEGYGTENPDTINYN